MTALDRIAWPDLHDPRLLIIPLGATEQHGPHLPLSTDTEIAQALADRLALAVPGAFLAPTLPYGASGEHQAFPGTLSLGVSATRLVLVELARSATETFPCVLFVCAHGGNARPLAGAVAQLRGEGRDVRAWIPGWPGDAHAGELETSLMLALAGERVTLAHARAGNRSALAELMPALRAQGVRAVSATGVLGDPTAASAAQGHALLAAERERMMRMVREWLSDA